MTLESWCAVVVAIATWIGVLLVLFQLRSESYRSRFLTQVELTLRFDEIWHCDRTRSLRKKAAKHLMAGPTDDIDKILDFFQSIGSLLKRRALDEVLAWEFFFHCVHHYMTIANRYIEEERRLRRTLWQDAIYLHRRLMAVEERINETAESELIVTDDEAVRFCNDVILSNNPW